MPIFFVDEGSSKACTLSEGPSQEPQLSCGGDSAVDVSVQEDASGGATVHVGTETLALPNDWKAKNYFIARSLNASAARFRILDDATVAKLTGSQPAPVTLAIGVHAGADITPAPIPVAPPPVIQQTETAPILPESCKNLSDASTGADFKRCQTDKAAAIKENGGVLPTRTIETGSEPTEPGPAGNTSTAVPVGVNASVLYNFASWARAGGRASLDYVFNGDHPYWVVAIGGGGELELASIGLGIGIDGNLSFIDGTPAGTFTLPYAFYKIANGPVALQVALQVNTDGNLYFLGGLGYRGGLGGGPDVDTADISAENHDKAEKIVRWAEALAFNTSILLDKAEKTDPWNPERVVLIDQVKQNIDTLHKRQAALSAWRHVTFVDDQSLNDSVSEIERLLKELTDPVKTTQATYKAFEAGLKDLYSLASATFEESQPGENSPQEKLAASLNDVESQSMAIRHMRNGKEQVREILAAVDALIVQGQFILDHKDSLPLGSDTNKTLQRVGDVMNLLPGLRTIVKLHLDSSDKPVPAPEPSPSKPRPEPVPEEPIRASARPIELSPVTQPTPEPAPVPVPEPAPVPTPEVAPDPVRPAEPAVKTTPAEILQTVKDTADRVETAWKRMVGQVKSTSSRRVDEKDLTNLRNLVNALEDSKAITDPDNGLIARLGKERETFNKTAAPIRKAHQDYPTDPTIKAAYDRLMKIEGALDTLPPLLTARASEIGRVAAAREATEAARSEAEARAAREAEASATTMVGDAHKTIGESFRTIVTAILGEAKFLDLETKREVTAAITKESDANKVDAWLAVLDQEEPKILKHIGVIEAQLKQFPGNTTIQGRKGVPDTTRVTLEFFRKALSQRKNELAQASIGRAAQIVKTLQDKLTGIKNKLGIKTKTFSETDIDQALETKGKDFVQPLRDNLQKALEGYQAKELVTLAELQGTNDPGVETAAEQAGQIFNQLSLILGAVGQRLTVLEQEAGGTKPTESAPKIEELPSGQILMANRFEGGIPPSPALLRTQLKPTLDRLSKEKGQLEAVVVVVSQGGATDQITQILKGLGIEEKRIIVKINVNLVDGNLSGPQYAYFHTFPKGSVDLRDMRTQGTTRSLFEHTQRYHQKWFPVEKALEGVEIRAEAPKPVEDPYKEARASRERLKPIRQEIEKELQTIALDVLSASEVTEGDNPTVTGAGLDEATFGRALHALDKITDPTTRASLKEKIRLLREKWTTRVTPDLEVIRKNNPGRGSELNSFLVDMDDVFGKIEGLWKKVNEEPKGAEPTAQKSVPDILAAIAGDPNFGTIKHNVLKPVERYQDPKAKLEQALVAKFGDGVIPFFTGLKVVSSGTTMGIPHVDTLLKIVQAHVPDAEGILVLVHESNPGSSAIQDFQPNGRFARTSMSYFKSGLDHYEKTNTEAPQLKLDTMGVGQIVLGKKQEPTTRYQIVVVRRGTNMGEVREFIRVFANKVSDDIDKIPRNYSH